MLHIAGYSFTEILYRSAGCIVYRGTRSSDGMPVVCKHLNREYPSVMELSSFRREFQVTAKLGGAGAVRAYALAEVDNSLAMILEDAGGVSLDKNEPLRRAGMGEKLSFAASAAEALSLIHGEGVIHKDVAPANIICDPRTGEARFIDFGLSVELASENMAGSGAGILEGTLEYISPEQTGRMNSPVDFRSDLYSLGAVLYELFSGKPPFTGKDDLELVYGHIARLPAPLDGIDRGIPGPVSAIIAKLLKKDKEERYQSAAGLAADLRRCAREYSAKGSIAPFVLGGSDGSGAFSIPRKLYGRQEEVSALLKAFGEAANGASRLLLVSGEPGIGKTTLIQEIHKSISTGKTFFVAGKFNQRERNVPYGAAIQAFEALAAELAMMPESFLEELRERTGPGKAAILELVPGLSAALGASDPAPPLDPVAAQNRLQLALRGFLAALAGEDRPVVIFLDDLQWCDLSTLDLIKHLAGRNAVPRLLLVGAFRENEVTEGHPLMALLRAPESFPGEAEQRVRRIRLRPLTKENLNHLVADALRRDPGSTLELSSVLYAKTGGNPFYANQALLSLRDKGAFSYDPGENRWNWDMAAVRDAELGANVIEFLEARLGELPSRAIAVLKAAACIGDVFDARILHAVCGLPPEELESGIWTAIEREIIVPRSGEYRLLGLERLDFQAAGAGITFKFQHDRLRQALLSLAGEEEKRLLHARIGTEMLKAYRGGASEAGFFEMVNHMNSGVSPGDGAKKRMELADLNKAAGDKAMKATAFQTAADFYASGLAQAAESEWKSLPGLRFGLLRGKAEAAFLSGDPDTASAALEEAGAAAGDELQAAALSVIRSRILEFKGELYAAVGEIRRGLAPFGVKLPDDSQEIQKAVQEGIGRLLGGLARRPAESLSSLGEMKDERMAMAMRLLAQSVPAAIQVDYPLYLLITLTMMDLTLGFGLTQESCKCVADVGILVASMLGDYETGYRLGKAAFELIDRLKAEGQRPAVYFSFTYVSHMRKGFREGLDYYELSYKKGLELGDMQHAMYALSHKLHLMAWVGADLRDVERESRDAMAFLAESRGFIQLKLVEIVLQAVEKFRTPLGDPGEERWPKADGERLEQINAMKHMVLLVRFSQYSAFFHFLMGDAGEAAKWNEMAEQVIFASGTDFPVADHYLVRALLLLDGLKASENGAREAEAVLPKVEASIATLKKWADACPENFAHKHLLASAELSAFRGEPLEKTLELYRSAAAAIGTGDFQQMSALVNEREGRFWLERGEEAIAKAFLQEAHYQYGRWGALRKTQSMERVYPVQFAGRTQGRESAGKRSSADSKLAVSNDSLDIGSITKSVQAISGEIKTEGLLKTLMGIVMENAGAQKGCILLDHGDGRGLRVEARKGPASEEIELAGSVPYRESGDLCREIAEYVERGKQAVSLDKAYAAGLFRDTPYIRANRVKSLLCMPILRLNSLKGMLYLENNLSEGVFTAERLAVLEVLAAQASISMENARLYANMEEKVAERTRQLNQANEKLQELALIDPLTRLNNRRYFLEYVIGVAGRLSQRLIRSLEGSENRMKAAPGSVMGVYLLDLDHFKDVNDSWGHAAGDTVLMEISRTLKSIIRADDFIIRWGGEEFLVILNDTKAEYLDAFARKALEAVSALSVNVRGEESVRISCSIGYASFPFAPAAPGSLSLEQTISLTDHAMYFAKRDGRNRAVRIYFKESCPRAGKLPDILKSVADRPESSDDCVGTSVIVNGG